MPFLRGAPKPRAPPEHLPSLPNYKSWNEKKKYGSFELVKRLITVNNTLSPYQC